MTEEETPIEVGAASLADLWRQIALYLEIWDLLQELVAFTSTCTTV
jgi:hypothetical protein